MRKIFSTVVILLGMTVFVFLMAGLTTKINNRNKSMGGEVNPSPTPRPEFADLWGIYENQTEKYSVFVPADWEAAEMKSDGNFDSRTIINPGKEGPVVGNIAELSITVVSKPKTGQELSSLKEFNLWRNKPDMSTDSARTQKMNNTEIDGINAINFVSSGEDDQKRKYWMIMTWLRKNNTNYYLNTLGYGDYTGEELWIHNKMTASFKFL